MGFFFGFKLHLMVNEKGEILSFVITPGNDDDRKPLKDNNFLNKNTGSIPGIFIYTLCDAVSNITFILD